MPIYASIPLIVSERLRLYCNYNIGVVKSPTPPHNGQLALSLVGCHGGLTQVSLHSFWLLRWKHRGSREEGEVLENRAPLLPSLEWEPQLRETHRSPSSSFKVGTTCQPQALPGNGLAHFPGTWEGCLIGGEPQIACQPRVAPKSLSEYYGNSHLPQ